MAYAQSRGTQIKIIVAAALAVFSLIVIFQNTGPVDTTVLFGTFSMPLALLLTLTFSTGGLVGAVVYHRMTRKKPGDPA